MNRQQKSEITAKIKLSISLSNAHSNRPTPNQNLVSPYSLFKLLLAFIISFSFRIMVMAMTVMVLISVNCVCNSTEGIRCFHSDWHFPVVVQPYQHCAEQHFQIEFSRLFENIGSFCIFLSFQVSLFMCVHVEHFLCNFFSSIFIYIFLFTFFFQLLSALQANINKMIAANTCV